MLRVGLVFLAVLALAASTPGWSGQSDTDASVMRGKAAFERRCTGCHALDRNREGPRLRGVIGRPSASVGDFPYSDALKALKITWDTAKLEKWLSDPDAMAPGTDMDFHVANESERKEIARYLDAASHTMVSGSESVR
ncbi:c-type cytochrome [Acidicapsa dinghuensis]|uniref:C-type cytochrome n=1 Tax=Acidicapsa dinghuensis TaxID=2218256 RepID=A0ABW1EF44_9BACT|nr:c-type cytochrome [Acidicapsa dinghuensis]